MNQISYNTLINNNFINKVSAFFTLLKYCEKFFGVIPLNGATKMSWKRRIQEKYVITVKVMNLK